MTAPRVWIDFAAFEAWYATLRDGLIAVPGVKHAHFFEWLKLGSPGAGPPPHPWPPEEDPLPTLESEPLLPVPSVSDAPPWETSPSEAAPSAAPAEDRATPVPEETTPRRRVRWTEPRAVADLVAYTDGSGTQAHLACGAGVVVVDGRPETVATWTGVEGVPWIGGGVVVLEVSWHLGLGTNNHAEVCAAGLALGVTDTPDWHAVPLEIRTDSTYVQGCLTAAHDPSPQRPNARVIGAARRRMRERADEHGEVWPARRVTVHHVEGHTGEPGNDRADALAGAARLRPPTPQIALARSPSTRITPEAP